MTLTEEEQKILLDLFKRLVEDYKEVDFDIIGKDENLIAECEKFLESVE